MKDSTVSEVVEEPQFTSSEERALDKQFEEGTIMTDVLPKLDKWWWSYPHLLKLNLLLLGPMLINATNGYDGSMLNGLQSLPQWTNYLNHPSGPILGTLSSAIAFGTVVVMPIIPWTCDRFGRRWPLIGGSFIVILGAILQACAQNFAMFFASRFIIGIGSSFVGTAGPLLLSETAYPGHRAIITSTIEPCYPLGALAAAWITFGTYNMQSTWAWRLPSLLQCVPSMIQIICGYFCPESPRWLIYQNRVKQARDSLTKHHAGGDANSRLVDFEMAEIMATLELEKVQKSGRWSEWLKTKGNRHRLFIALFIPCISQLSGSQIISYYLPVILNGIGITDSKQQLIINATIQIDQLVSAVFVVFFVESLGRRKMFFAGLIGMSVCLLCWSVMALKAQQTNFESPAFGRGTLAFIYLFEVVYHISAPIVPTYVVETAPYSLRSKSYTIYSFMVSCIGFFNSYVNPVALGSIGAKYYFVFLAFVLVQIVVVYFMFPETKGMSLEEISELFDGDRAAIQSGADPKPEVGHVETV